MGFAHRLVAPAAWIAVSVLSGCTLTRSLDDYDRGGGPATGDAGADVAPDVSQDAAEDARQDALDDVAQDAAEDTTLDVHADVHADVQQDAVAEDAQAEGGCPANFEDCDGDASNGCETDTRTSLEHCGACDAACSAPSGEVACQAGSCHVLSCPPGTADCNGATIDGCEANVTTSADHCGACGQPCPPPHAADGTCTGGSCTFTCSPGFDDCDADPLTGCEAELALDPSNCGTCGNVCAEPPNALAECQTGTLCSWSCLALRGDCDGDVQNGCERDVSGDTANCGACNLACPASFNCNTGLCSCTNPQSCDHGGGGKCSASGAIKVCECANVKCQPGEVCLPGELCGPVP